MSDSELGSPKRNTGYVFDLVDEDAVERNENGIMTEPMAQTGNYDTRHEAVGMAAILGRRFDFDYDVRWRESIWRKTDEPAVCDYCGHEEPYRPLVDWTFAINYGPDEDDGGAFCNTECFARWSWQNYPDELRGLDHA